MNEANCDNHVFSNTVFPASYLLLKDLHCVLSVGLHGRDQPYAHKSLFVHRFSFQNK